MGFSTALSGLAAAQNNLSVTGNNIANANTVGFKKSRSEFADVYASSMGGVSKIQPGSGVRVTEVAQQFGQGNIEYTENSLDLAISGNGFFTLADDPGASKPTMYTRSGAFQLNKDGYVVNDQNRYLMAYAANDPADISAGFSQGVFQPLQIDTAQGLPSATENVTLQVNLDSTKAAPPSTTPFSIDDSNSYNNVTSSTIYDSQGNPHKLSTYFVKDATTANTWNVYTFLDGKGIEVNPNALTDPTTPVTDPGTPSLPTPIVMTFTPGGALQSLSPLPTSTATTPPITASATRGYFGPITSTYLDPGLSVDNMTFEIDFLKSTQYSTPFSVNAMTQDGLPAGNLTGIDVDNTGVVFARYTNGAAKALGQVALARFANNQGLAKVGDTTWAENASSGQPVFGAGGSNNFGTMQSAALEASNVELATQLVNLIIAQQTYQANAQTITTENSIMQTILNIR